MQVWSQVLFHSLCKFMKRHKEFIPGQYKVIKWQNTLRVTVVHWNQKFWLLNKFSVGFNVISQVYSITYALTAFTEDGFSVFWYLIWHANVHMPEAELQHHCPVDASVFIHIHCDLELWTMCLAFHTLILKKTKTMGTEAELKFSLLCTLSPLCACSSF